MFAIFYVLIKVSWFKYFVKNQKIKTARYVTTPDNIIAITGFAFVFNFPIIIKDIIIEIIKDNIAINK